MRKELSNFSPEMSDEANKITQSNSEDMSIDANMSKSIDRNDGSDNGLNSKSS